MNIAFSYSGALSLTIINYLIHEFFVCIVFHELALVHEFSEFLTVHEQPMFMYYKVRVHERNKLMNSWTFMKVSFVD